MTNLNWPTHPARADPGKPYQESPISAAGRASETALEGAEAHSA